MAGATVLEKLATSAAARRAGVSEQSIRQWAKSGRLPVEQTPPGMLIDRDVLERVLRQRAHRTAAARTWLGTHHAAR